MGMKITPVDALIRVYCLTESSCVWRGDGEILAVLGYRLSMSRTYRIPNLLAPRKTCPITNVNMVTLEEEHNRCVDSFPLPGDAERAGCKRGQIPLFASCCYPTAELETLHAVVSHVIALIFLGHANDTASVEEAEGSVTRLYPHSMTHPRVSNHPIDSSG